jgi:hypothetical protein
MSNKVLICNRIQKFAKWARHYILGYSAIHRASIGNDQQDNENSEQILPAKLEQTVQKVKNHRCAMDSDHGFCKAIFRECDWTNTTSFSWINKNNELFVALAVFSAVLLSSLSKC